MTTNVIANRGIAIATSRPARSPEADETDGKDDDYRFEQRFSETRHGMFDDDRLIRHQVDSHPDRKVGDDLGHFLLQGLAELQQVGA